MSSQESTEAQQPQEREGVLLQRMLSALQSLQGREGAQIEETQREETSYGAAAEVTEYTFPLEGHVPSPRPENILKLSVIREEAKSRFQKPKTVYFLYRQKNFNQTDDQGKVIDVIKEVSRFKIVVEPRVMRPTNITVEEAEKGAKSRNREYSALRRMKAVEDVNDRHNLDIKSTQPEPEATKVYTTAQEQEEFLQYLLK